jgi:signal transduction histidine kinase
VTGVRALRRFISKRLQTADRWLDNRAQNTILLVSLGLALLIGFVDIHGNSNLLIVYVLPMALGAWYGGRRVGVVLAIYCSAEWFVAASLTTGTPAFSLDALITFLVRLAIFLVLTSALARQRESARQQKLLTEFIVHDLRSPISSAITGLQTLQLSADHLAPEDAEMVSLSLISNQRALALVNSMLDVSKLESGSMDLHIE